VILEYSRPQSQSEQRLYRMRTTPPRVGSVPWKRNETRELIITLSVAGALAVVGIATGWSLPFGVLAFLWTMGRVVGWGKRASLLKSQNAFLNKLSEDAGSGVVHCVECRSTRLIEREEFEDEGAFYVFDGDDDNYLALVGQDFYETPRFPSDHFEIVRGGKHRILLGIRSRGKKLAPVRVVGGEQLPWDDFPTNDVTIFSAPRGAEVKTILNALAEQSKPR
jgi:hypothetical protein